MGVGRGLARRNFDAMNVDIDESRERFWEVYDIVQLLFTQEMFSYEGQFYSYKNASLRPRPLDPRIVTEAWGTWTSETSLREMAERGMQPMTTPNKTLESYVEDMHALQLDPGRERARAGRGNRSSRCRCTAREDAHAEQDDIRQWINEYVDSVLQMYELGTENFAPGQGPTRSTGRRAPTWVAAPTRTP